MSFWVFWMWSSLVYIHASVVSVEPSQFKEGSRWEWLYSYKNPQSGNWEPYFLERYSVTKVENNFVTLEMASAPAGQEIQEPHHRIKIDLKKCERSSLDPKFKNFGIEFYTKNLDSHWTLVSKIHENLAFTEKFSCYKTLNTSQQVLKKTYDFQNEKASIFQVLTSSKPYNSFYFLDYPTLKGVAAYKIFPPHGNYRFDLVNTQ